MPLNAKMLQFEVARSHIVRNFIRIPNLSSDFFQLASGASASLFPPERLPLLLRVALESDGGFTTQTLQTKTQLFLYQKQLILSFQLLQYTIQKTKSNVGFIFHLHAQHRSKTAARQLSSLLSYLSQRQHCQRFKAIFSVFAR